MKLQNNILFAWLLSWPLIKLWDIGKEIMVWKLQPIVVFLFLKETKFEVDTTT